MTTNGATPVLEVSALSAGFGAVSLLSDINLCVHAGEVVALLGPNGAGKTTTIMALAGHMSLMHGEVRINGELARRTPHGRARRGMGVVTQERCVFMGLSVRDNLRLGRGKSDEVLDLFPELRPHLHRRVGLLSGGQQQMLAVGRALAARPQVLLTDELSFGLAPLVVDRILRVMREYVDTYRIAALLVEQHIHKALQCADRAYVLQRGRIVMSGPCESLRGRLDELHGVYVRGTGDVSANGGHEGSSRRMPS
jgi:ABC-type branched-subunit amino acid transport system ATPase component